MKKIIVFILLSAFIISAPAAVHAENAGPGSSAAVTLGDAMRALKYTAHKGDLTFTEKQTWDIDNDGKIGLTDVMKIFMVACGKYELPKPERYIQPGFIISTFYTGYSTDPAVMENILTLTKEAGFNLIENGWVSGETAAVTAEAAEKVGIDFLLQEMNVYSGFQGGEFPFPEESVIEAVCEKYSDYEHFKGIFIWDEPVMETIPVTRRLKDIFEEHMPGKLMYSCALPSYGIYKWDMQETYPRYIDEYVSLIDPDVISFDYYPYLQTDNIVYSSLWQDLGYIRKKALETNKPLWVYFQALSNSLAYEPGNFTIEKIKSQVFPLLCYGVAGLSYFTSAGSVVYNNEKAPLYDDISALNKRVKNIGDFLLSKNNEAIYHCLRGDRYPSLYNLDRFEDSALMESATMKNSVIGQFGEYSSPDKYLLIANKHHEDISSGQITFRYPVTVYEIDTDTMESTLVAENTTELQVEQPPAEAALYKICP